ncbi:hypothetical protein AKO1_011399, partial [Acrasis kona]
MKKVYSVKRIRNAPAYLFKVTNLKNKYEYHTDIKHFDCSCMDYFHGGGKPCKHIDMLCLDHIAKQKIKVDTSKPDIVHRAVISHYWPALEKSPRSIHMLSNPRAASKQLMKPARGYSTSPNRKRLLQQLELSKQAKKKGREAEPEVDDSDSDSSVVSGFGGADLFHQDESADVSSETLEQLEALERAEVADTNPSTTLTRKRKRTATVSPAEKLSTDPPAETQTSTTPIKRRRKVFVNGVFSSKQRRISTSNSIEDGELVVISHSGVKLGEGMFYSNIEWHSTALPQHYGVIGITAVTTTLPLILPLAEPGMGKRTKWDEFKVNDF